VTTPQKRKGSAFELEVARFLQGAGFPHAERAYGAGRQDDRGDIDGLPGLVIECKNHKTHDLSGWLDEAERERNNARADYGVVVVKRRGKAAAKAYAVLTLEDFARLWAERDGR